LRAPEVQAFGCWVEEVVQQEADGVGGDEGALMRGEDVDLLYGVRIELGRGIFTTEVGQ
jgi:hypothetical protein